MSLFWLACHFISRLNDHITTGRPLTGQTAVTPHRLLHQIVRLLLLQLSLAWIYCNADIELGVSRWEDLTSRVIAEEEDGGDDGEEAGDRGDETGNVVGMAMVQWERLAQFSVLREV